MPSRAQHLINLGALAVAFCLGSISTAFVLPALRPKDKAALRVARQVRSAGPIPTPPSSPDPKSVMASPLVVPAGAAAAKPDVKAAGRMLDVVPIVAPESPILALKFGGAPAAVPNAIPPNQPAAPQAPGLTPGQVLQKKGLLRSNLVYILKDDEKYNNDITILWNLYDEWILLLNNMSTQVEYYNICYNTYFVLQQRLQAQIAASQSRNTGSGGSTRSDSSAPATRTGQGATPENTTTQTGGGVHANPLFKDIKDNSLFKDVKTERKEPPAVKEKEKDEKSSSPYKLNVVLPRVFFQVAIPTSFEQCEYGMAVARNRYDTLELMAFRKAMDIKRQQGQVISLAKQLKLSYDALARDQEVMSALTELNKTERPQVALGPQADYEANLKKMTERQLRAEGIERKTNGGTYGFTFVKKLEFMTRESASELKEALVDQQHQRKQWHDGEKQRLRRRDEAIFKNNPKALKDLQKEDGFAEAERLRLAQAVRTRREAYLQNVAALRVAVDEAPLKIAAWQKEDPKVKIEPIPDSIIASLSASEATIKTAVVALEPEKTVFWVETIINGIPNQKMVFDPGVKMVRISGSFASALGINVTDRAAPETVVVDDGRELPGRRLTLESIQVGPFKAENVECLVILDGFDAPALLGASFLDRFASRPDLAAATLTLVQIDLPTTVKPARSGAPARAKGAGKKAGK